jgi:hypothetical protein
MALTLFVEVSFGRYLDRRSIEQTPSGGLGVGGQQQQGCRGNRHYIVRQKLEQFRTTERYTRASGNNSYSLGIYCSRKTIF